MGRSKPGSAQSTRSKWRWFYYGDELYKLERILRPSDEIYATRISDGKLMIMSWSDVQRRGHIGLSTSKVSVILNRDRDTFVRLFADGFVKPPQKISSNKTGKMIWSHKNVWEMWEALKSIQHGGHKRGRKNTRLPVNKRNLPNESELRAALEHRLFVYALSEDGEYVPMWQAENW